jgi:hypothetical protein
MVGHLNGMQHNGLNWVLACRRIRMEDEFAIAGTATVNPVGDVVDRRRHRFAGLHGLWCRRLRLSEPARESQLLIRCDGLIPEKQKGAAPVEGRRCVANHGHELGCCDLTGFEGP